MKEMIQLLIGAFVLLIGIPLGNYLAKNTGEELRLGRKWFKLIILISFIGALVGLIIRDDVLLFTFAFIAIVTSRSLKSEKKNSKK